MKKASIREEIVDDANKAQNELQPGPWGRRLESRKAPRILKAIVKRS